MCKNSCVIAVSHMFRMSRRHIPLTSQVSKSCWQTFTYCDILWRDLNVYSLLTFRPKNHSVSFRSRSNKNSECSVSIKLKKICWHTDSWRIMGWKWVDWPLVKQQNLNFVLWRDWWICLCWQFCQISVFSFLHRTAVKCATNMKECTVVLHKLLQKGLVLWLCWDQFTVKRVT